MAKKVSKLDEAGIKKAVRKGYANVAKSGGCGCGCGPSDCAGEMSKSVGYSEKEMAEVPDGANLGLGCGNPVALASLKKGETVMDLGSGAGFDAFLAANRVGNTGRVIGVDMTPEMLDKARANAKKGKYANVEFRLGEIENLPAADNSVDVIISNCVINLAPDKDRVFCEAARVLKKGGRLMVSDIVLLKPLPKPVMDSMRAYVGCLSGAIMKDGYIKSIGKAGFKNVKVLEENHYPVEYVMDDATAKELGEAVKLTKKDADALAKAIVSVKVSAVKK
ncbi:MAG: arsenite methyltransferase [Methanobacteriota archaeon]